MEWFWNLPFYDRIQIGVAYATFAVPGWLIVRQLDQIIALLRSRK